MEKTSSFNPFLGLYNVVYKLSKTKNVLFPRNRKKNTNTCKKIVSKKLDPAHPFFTAVS